VDGSKHAFVDESVRAASGYMICAVTVSSGDLPDIRRALRAMRLGGQSRIHMGKESPSRRRALLSDIGGLDVETHLFVVSKGGVSDRVLRDICLEEVGLRLPQLGVSRLVIESCDQDRQDVQVLRGALLKVDKLRDVTYQHEKPAAEPLLWLPDMVAWAYGKGGDWQRRAKPLIAEVHRLRP